MIEVNSTLVVNCTLVSGYRSRNWSSADLYFQLGESRLDDYTHVLDETTAQLRMPVNRFYSEVHLPCYLTNYTNSKGSMLGVAETMFSVGGESGYRGVVIS